MTAFPCYIVFPLGVWPALGCVVIFAMMLSLFWWSHRGMRCFYFDPQDFARYEGGGGRELPVSAQMSTFSEHLKHYISVTQLLITVAAASIAFGANQNPRIGIFIAKIILASAILYGVLFAALLLYFYDEYSQNVRAYTRLRYSLVEALGFSSFLCFIAGYFV